MTPPVAHRPLGPLVWLFTGFVAIVATFLAFELLPLPRDVTPVSSAVFVQADTAPRTLALPDNWRSDPNRTLVHGTYRIALPPLDPDVANAVYIPNFSGQLRVTIGGIDLSPGGILSGELIPDQSVPFFSIIPTSVITNGGEVVLTLTPGGQLKGFLGQVYIGPEADLRASHGWHYFRAIQLPSLVLFWLVLLGVVLLVLWANRRQERAALYGALILMFSSVHALPAYLPTALGLAGLVTQLGLVLNLWMSVIGLLFVYALADRTLPIKLRWLIALPAIGSVAFFALPASVFALINNTLVVPFSLILVVWIVVTLVRGAIFERRQDMLLVLISILGSVTLTVHDVLVLSNALPNSNFLHFRVAFVLILPSLSVVFIHRLIASLNHVDDLVQTLEERISAAESDLRASYTEQQTLESERALNAERQRIMRDVHDGLGGQLVSIIAMSRLGDTDASKIERSAEAALDDLRLVIGSLNVENDITGMLGTFRERVEQQLAVHDIALVWRMIDIPRMEGLNPSRALNILRIMQEATTNVVKHAEARTVTISFVLEDDDAQCLRIDLQDDGRGIDDVQASDGHGLENMAQRAKELGGNLEVAALDQGTRVSLWVPTRRDATA